MNLLRRLTFAALFAAVLALSLTACGGASDEELEKARQQGAEEQKQQEEEKAQEEKQEELEKKIEKLEKEAKKDGDSSSSSSGSNSSGSNTGGSVANCGNGLTVGPNTTCSFAENVRSEWASAGGGSVTIEVYSPVTGATYSMRCTAGTTTVCRGGNNASVYIR